MSALSAYLAKNYLNASSSSTPTNANPDFATSDRPKKRRKKDKSGPAEGSGLLIADDDADLLLSRRNGQDDRDRDRDGDGDTPMMYTGTVKSAEFRKTKGGGSWNTISGPTSAKTTESGKRDAEEAEADAILNAAAAASEARRQEMDAEDAPAIVEADDDDDSAPKMESGVRAGLQTAADTKRLLEREARERRKERKLQKRREEPGEEEEETVYRDATGRRIDVSMKRAEARQREMEKVQAEKKAKEEAMGDVQRREKVERKVELEEARFLTLGRGVEDEEMNERLKGVVRWGDVMANYAGEEDGEGGKGGKGKGESVAVAAKNKTQKKVYQGSAAPNRYGIMPGWRWDGVDRGNGFEKEWFQARSNKSRNEGLAYQWQMDE